ncbi:MAG TPA: hypothetical protein VEV62_19750 [Parafilimonas sp.]|nr:hypothetical protein [Parafilimonas sp.]
MSVILNPRSTDVLDSVFIFYDFKQILDAIMIVTFVEGLNRWQKIFVYNSEDGWEIETLKNFLDSKKFEWLSKKLNLIFQNREQSEQFEGIDITKEIEQNAGFEFSLNAI